jgi:hypothetical protein
MLLYIAYIEWVTTKVAQIFLMHCVAISSYDGNSA